MILEIERAIALNVEHTVKNVYIKLSEKSASRQAILSAVNQKVSGSIPADDFILLNAKLIPVFNEKGQLTV